MPTYAGKKNSHITNIIRQDNYFNSLCALVCGKFMMPYPNDKFYKYFLVQEPNEHYDKWYPENCTPKLISEFILERWDPTTMEKSKYGSKSRKRQIRPRMVICLEDGNIFKSYRDCLRHYGFKSINCNGGSFTYGMRFAYIDPYIPDDSWQFDPWLENPRKHQAQYKVHNRKGGIVNATTRPIYCVEEDKEYPMLKSFCETHPGYNTKGISRALRYNRPYKGYHFEER